MFYVSRWGVIARTLICLLAGNSVGSDVRNRSPAVRREPGLYIVKLVQDQPADGRSSGGAVPRAHQRTPPTVRQRPAPMVAEPGSVRRCDHQLNPPPDIRTEMHAITGPGKPTL